MRFFFFLAVLSLFPRVNANAQEQDTLYSIDEGIAEDDVVIYKARKDSLRIEKRAFDEETFRQLKSDPDLNYESNPTIAESVWSRFLRWLGSLIEKIFSTAVTTNWGRVVVYLLGLALLVMIIMMVLKVNAFRVLFSGAGATQQYQVLEDNIHEMDFEKLIRDAMEEGDYRRGVRLLFLYALKLLSDRQLIHWESGKTNHDYVGELPGGEVRSGLNKLSFYFEYAWYGNFRIDRETFDRAHSTFTTWRDKLR